MAVRERFKGEDWLVLETSKMFEIWRKGEGKRFIMNVHREPDEPFDILGIRLNYDVYGIEKDVFNMTFQNALRPILENREYEKEIFANCFRQYMHGDKRYAPILAMISGGRVRILDIFEKVNDEIFEWFLTFTKLAQRSEIKHERTISLIWALDALNAMYVRIRESAPNPYVGEFVLALWSVKYRQEFDNDFWNGLKQLKLSAPLLWQENTSHIQVMRLNQIEQLCKSNDEELFIRFPQMRESVQILRKSGRKQYKPGDIIPGLGRVPSDVREVQEGICSDCGRIGFVFAGMSIDMTTEEGKLMFSKYHPQKPLKCTKCNKIYCQLCGTKRYGLCGCGGRLDFM